MSATPFTPDSIRLSDLSRAFRAVKYPLFLVGGSVRDLLLSLPLSDLDVAVDGPLEESARIFASCLQARPIYLGRPPGQVCRFAWPGLQLDLTELTGGSIDNELARRDMTINAMAVEITPEFRDNPARLFSAPVIRSSLIDPFHGLDDLTARRAGFVSEAVIIQDPLRLLRLFRFATLLNLVPQPESLAMVEKHAGLISSIAGERIREELIKTLSAPDAFPMVKAMAETGLLQALIPGFAALIGVGQNEFHHLDVFSHTLESFRCLEEILSAPERFFPDFQGEIKAYFSESHRAALVKLAILLHDLGKPEARTEGEAGDVHFYRHEIIGEELAARICRRFKLARFEETLVRFMVRHHLQPFHLYEARRKGTLKARGVYRFNRLTGPDLWGLMVHALADAMATRGPVQFARGGLTGLLAFMNRLLMVITRQRAEQAELAPLISGAELMKLFNLKPSPVIGRLLNVIREAQAVGEVRDRDEAVFLAERLMDQEDEELN